MRRRAARLCPYLLLAFAAGAARAGEVPLPPAPPGSAEVELRFLGFGGFELQGTLTLPAPAPKGGAPGVLLLPGSGPTDRNGNQPPYLFTDLLKQIAERLAHEGFATLRFDKRAAAGYAARWPPDPAQQDAFFGWEAFTGDARAALETLRRRSEVEGGRTAVVGHSEGGLIALQLAQDLSLGTPPAALVLAGTAGARYDDLIRYQVARALDWQGADEATREQYRGALDRAIRSIVDSGTVPGDLPVGLSGLFPRNATRLLRSYFTLDPVALAGAYRGPVLLLHGALDNQVPAQEHTARLLTALAARAGGVQESVVVAGASHNLKPVSALRDLGVAGAVAPEALDALVAFLTRVLESRAAGSRR